MIPYITEAHETRIRGQAISVVNLTPNFREDQKNTVKNSIEQRLYEIFCQYVSSETETGRAAHI